MPSFGRASLNILAECHIDLQTVFFEVIKTFDFSILVGYRGQVLQDAAFAAKKSKVKFPFSTHNCRPAEGVDVAPYPIDWKDEHRFIYFAGYVMAVADRLLIQGRITYAIKWGGDFNKNGRLDDDNFVDLDHFQLIKPKGVVANG